MKKIIALADVHYSKESQDLALASLEAALEVGRREEIDAWTFAGDLFDRGIQNAASSGFPRLVAMIQRMLEVAPIVSVRGTPTHDAPGCYAVLAELRADNRFYDLEPAAPLILNDILFLGLPEMGKEWFLAGSNGIGAEEANQKIIEGVRRILLGMGAIRQKHHDLPCVFLAHCTVRGASMQNGQIADSGIALGKEDLALIGFDFANIGHIHLEQQIGDLPAYYPGPAYHTDWGHLGQCGFNLVTLDTFGIRAVVHRLSFPHPPRAKFVVTWPEPVGDEIMGRQAWVCYRATKEEAARIDKDALLEAYIATGALPGSRVTVEIIPTETVRAAEITSKHALRDKLEIYDDASEMGGIIKDSVLEKANQLEREAESAGLAPEGLHIRLRSLRLRGAIGIAKGQHVDEISLDLDRYDAGLIALVGSNGAGKTTLIENMHPYPQMLTRDGTLQSHFRLRDSLRELTFADERTGAEYRALIQIDGANASGSCEYHLFRNGEPLTNGRKADYEAVINRLFGSLPLFLRSAFVSQRATKNNPDLTEATKGEKKAIFRELAGLDYLQAYAEAAKGKGNAIETEISLEATRVNLLESQLTALPGIRADVEGKRADHVLGLGRLKEATTRLEAATREAEALAEKVRAQKSLEEKILALTDQAAQKQTAINLAEGLISDYQKAVELQPRAQKAVDTWTQLKEQEGKENEQITGISKERERLSTEYGRVQKAHSDACRELEGQQSKLRTKSAIVAGDRKVLQAQLENLARDLKDPLKEHCPTCAQVLPVATLAKLKAERVKSEDRLVDLSHQQEDMGQQIAEIAKALAAIVLPPAPIPPTLPPLDETGLSRILIEMGKINIEGARKALATAQEAATRIEETRKAADQAKAAADLIEYDLEAAKGALDPRIQPAYKAAQDRLAVAQFQRDQAQKAVASLEATIKAHEDRVAELERQAQDLEGRRAKIAAAKGELAEWKYLEKATGPDGIQALELDALGPSIAEVANRLLSAAFGTRFSVEFRTTRMAGRGASTRQVEDFQIWVIDGEDGSEQELSTLSGGESVWLKNAIYGAFGVIRERSTGTKFLTAFLDEMDGALDPEARMKYFAMLEALHHESGRKHTVVITHSETAQEAIAQRIVMAELERESAGRTA